MLSKGMALYCGVAQWCGFVSHIAAVAKSSSERSGNGIA